MHYFLVLLLFIAPVSADAPAKNSGDTSLSSAPSLSPQEKEWLLSHPRIRLALDTSLPPYSFIDSNGRFNGISVDILNILARKLEIKFELQPKSNWPNIVSAVAEDQIDVVASLLDNSERRAWFDFTHPYLTRSLVIMARKDDSSIKDRNDLSGKRVALVDNEDISGRIGTESSRFEPMPVPSMLDCLQAVETRSADACITFSGTAQFLQRQYRLENQRFAGFYERNTADESIAVRKDWQILTGILQKGLDTLSEAELQSIYSHWLPSGDALKPADSLRFAQQASLGVWQKTWLGKISDLLLPVLTFLVLYLYWQLRYSRNGGVSAEKSQPSGQNQEQLQNDFERMILKRIADLNVSEMKYRNLVENMNRDYFFYQRDRLGNMTYVSPSVVSVLGYEPDQFSRKFREYLTNNPANRRLGTIVDSTIQGIPAPSYQLEFFDSGNRRRWLEIADVPVYDEYGNCTGVDGLAFDITDRKLEEERLIWLSFHDDLTGLANRRLFTDRVQQAIPWSKRNSEPFAVFYLHVEKLRILVDELGHASGDHAVKHIANKLTATLRESDISACLGDGEFAVLLPATDLNASAIVAQKIIRNLREPLTFEKKTVKLDLTIGISLYPRHGSSPEALLQYADAGMQYARRKQLDFSYEIES